VTSRLAVSVICACSMGNMQEAIATSRSGRHLRNAFAKIASGYHRTTVLLKGKTESRMIPELRYFSRADAGAGRTPRHWGRVQRSSFGSAPGASTRGRQHSSFTARWFSLYHGPHFPSLFANCQSTISKSPAASSNVSRSQKKA